MLTNVLVIALIMLSLAIVGCLYRLLKGPTMPDRVIALDLIGIQIIGIIAIISMLIRTTMFVDIILLIGILAFLGTIAFSKFIEKGVVMEHERDVEDDH
jgi:multicomponent Na+:H+ antiporter subunit F